MSATANDLQPKKFKVKVQPAGHEKEYELECKPLRMSEASKISRIGGVLSDYENKTDEEVEKAEEELDTLIAKLIPELDGVQLDFNATTGLIEQIMGGVEPEDNQKLKEKGVTFGTEEQGKKAEGKKNG